MKVKIGFYAKTHFPIIWNTQTMPHLLLAGRTGGGKSILATYIANQLLNGENDVFLADYKAGGDWSEILKDDRYGEYKDCERILNEFYNSFQNVLEKKEPVATERFLIFDELNSFMLSLDNKKFKEAMEKLGTIAFLGRSYKHFLILVGQNFSATVLNTSIREQMSVKLYLSTQISTESQTMLFPNAEIDKSIRLPRFCGYISMPDRELDVIQVPFISKPQNLKKLLIQKGKMYYS